MSEAPGAPISIRLTEEADLAALEWSGAFAHHRQIIRDAYAAQTRGEGVMLLAESEGAVIGQAWLELPPKPDSEVPAAWAVRVAEPWQGRGVGAALMAGIEAEAQGRGYRALELAVEKANTGARRFYERLGWRVVRERREAYEYVTPEGAPVTQPLDEWVMAKSLSKASPTRA